MAKINQIQNALKELDGAIFQKLSDSYLLRKGYNQINPIGSVIGKNKTKTGTPDTLIPIENGKYIFVEYTTLEKGVFAKFSDDIQKCLDESKTGISIDKIQEIVLCFNTELGTKEIEDLRLLCEKSGVNLNQFGNGSISYDLLEKYPSIAKDYLGVEVDTGQIVPLDKFIKLYGSSKLATTLQTSFHFREKEREQLNSLLQNDDLVMVSGKSGSGKTRIAIECFRDFIKNNESYQGFCIFNQGIDLFEDIKSYFSDSGNYLILIDDANRISGFQYIIQLLQTKRDDQNFKIIVTVRDYALSKIQDVCKPVGSSEICIDQLTDDEIKSLVEAEFNITNHLYLDRITDISQGNPRLAIMAAKIANDTNSLESINDVSDLYDVYYSSIKTDLERLNDQNILKVAGIVSFFRTVDRTNKKLMLEIQENFHISIDDFWESAKQLHDMEVFDMFEDEVVKVSDQVLSSYLFYLVFFQDKIIDFSILLTRFFPSQKQRLIDAINPILSAFNYEKTKATMTTHVEAIWNDLQASNEQAFIQLVEVFWFLKPTETLLYFHKKIDSLDVISKPIEDISFKIETNSSLPEFLSTLPALRALGTSELNMSIDLLLNYVKRQPKNTPTILNVLVNKYGFEPESYRYGYHIQKAIIAKLIEKSQEGDNELFTRIFIAVSGEFLQTYFSITKAGRGHVVNFIQFSPYPSDEFLSLRSDIFNALFSLYKKYDKYRRSILSLPINNTQFGTDTSDNTIAQHDAKLLLPFFENELNPENLNHCITVQSFIKTLNYWNVPVEDKIKKAFHSNAYQLYDLLTNRMQKKELEMSSEEFQEYQREKVAKFTFDYTEQDYQKLFYQFSDVKNSLSQRNLWSIDQGINIIFDELADRNPDLFFTVVKQYLEQGEYLNINPWVVVSRLVTTSEASKAYDLISKIDFSAKDKWLFTYYEIISKEDIEESDTKELLNLYKIADIQNIPTNIDYLLKYEFTNKGLIEQVVQTLVDRSNTNSIIAHKLCNLFDPHADISKELLDLFSDVNLLEDAYLALDKTDPHCDYDGKSFSLLLNNNQNFLVKYLNDILSRKTHLSSYDNHRDFSFIWRRDDAFELINILSAYLFGLQKEGRVYDYFKVFFKQTVNDMFDNEMDSQVESNDEIIIKQNEYLLGEIRKKYDDIEYMEFIFSLISQYKLKYKLTFYQAFLEHNKNFDDFKKIQLEPTGWGCTGSCVPVFQKRVEFLQDMVSICNVVELLEHKQYLENKIKVWRERIKNEKKRDFTEQF